MQYFDQDKLYQNKRLLVESISRLSKIELFDASLHLLIVDAISNLQNVVDELEKRQRPIYMI